MEQKNKKEEIQSRREFFKLAARKVLPVIGLIAFANIPVVSQILNDNTTDCQYSCSNTCFGTHQGMCSTCSHQCFGGCQGTSKGKVQDSIVSKNDTIKNATGCNDDCKKGCRESCTSYCYQTCTGTCTASCYGSCAFANG